MALRTLAVKAVNPVTGHSLIINALLDTGSEVTAFSTSAARQLRLTSTVMPCGAFALQGFGGEVTTHQALVSGLRHRFPFPQAVRPVRNHLVVMQGTV